MGGEGEHETGSKEGKRIGLGSKFNEDEARKTVSLYDSLDEQSYSRLLHSPP